MRFATSRFYPIDQTNKVVYLDSQPTKKACTAFPNCAGMSGTHLNQQWEFLTQQGFTVKRLKRDRRGGAGRGQGRPPVEGLLASVNIRLAAGDYLLLKKHVAALRRSTGRAISIQDYGSKLILEADLNAIVPELKSLSGQVGATTVNEDADARLEELMERIKPLRQDIRMSRGAVFGAIIRVALGKQ